MERIGDEWVGPVSLSPVSSVSVAFFPLRFCERHIWLFLVSMSYVYHRLTCFWHHDIVIKEKEANRHNLTQFGRIAMSKSRDAKKDVKKKPSKTAKEKKKAKREKKNE